MHVRRRHTTRSTRTRRTARHKKLPQRLHRRGLAVCAVFITAVAAAVFLEIATDSFRGRLQAVSTADTLDGPAVQAGTTGGTVPGGDSTGAGAPPPRTMSAEAARAALPARLQQLQARYEQWLVDRAAEPAPSSEIPEPPPGGFLPPPPDAPGGEIALQRIQEGAQ